MKDRACVDECPVDCIYEGPGCSTSSPTSAWTAAPASRPARSPRSSTRTTSPASGSSSPRSTPSSSTTTSRGTRRLARGRRAGRGDRHRSPGRRRLGGGLAAAAAGASPAGRPGGRAGRNTRNDAPPPVALLDPRSAAVELGEPPHEREPDADPRCVLRRLGPLPERLEDRVAEVLGARPGRRPRRPAARPSASASDADPDRGAGRRVPYGVRQQVLDDPFDLGCVDRPVRPARRSIVQARVGDRARTRRHTRWTSAPTSVVVELRVHDAPGEPVEVQQVHDEAVEAPRVRRRSVARGPGVRFLADGRRPARG